MPRPTIARPLSLTIKQRLIALIVMSTVVIVGSLTAYFTSREITELTDDLRGKAQGYTELVARQVTSAVAFADKETAREVLASIGADPDVDGVVLLGDHGQELYRHGTPSTSAAGASPADAARTIETGAQIIHVTPVVSLEGPRGTLVLELSKRRVTGARARLTWIAAASGAVALAFSVLMAWMIARSFARRLHAIATVATAVAAGDLTQDPVQDGRRDEIGALASAFNAMLSQIKQLFHDGLSTRTEVTECSGRGVGMSALRAACEQTGGRITVASAAGAGTTFRFTWPAPRSRTYSSSPNTLYPS